MTDSDVVRRIVRDAVCEGVVDWVSLCELVASARRELPHDAGSTAVRDAVLDTVRQLLASDVMRAGQFGGEPIDANYSLREAFVELILRRDERRGFRFVPWNESIPDAVTRIQLEWTSLGRDPYPGEVCWFENTAAGDEYAARLEESAER